MMVNRDTTRRDTLTAASGHTERPKTDPTGVTNSDLLLDGSEVHIIPRREKAGYMTMNRQALVT